MKKAIDLLKKAGFNPSSIMIFVLCNWKIHYETCLLKLDLLKVWNVQVSDCYFDNQVFPDVKPVYWSQEQLKDFRLRCALHNQLINFRVYADLKRAKRYIKRIKARVADRVGVA